MKSVIKHSLAIILSLMLVTVYCPMTGFAESQAVRFVDAKGNPMECSDYTLVTDGISSMNDGWYVMKNLIKTDSRITVTGNVNLILCNYSNFIVDKGIYIQDDSSLTIWQQKAVTDSSEGGIIISAPDSNNAGIGGNDETVAGDLTINGGDLIISGGNYAAAIGGGCGEGSGYKSITINGGSITADSYYRDNHKNGAGIGGGENNNTQGPITINGGVIITTAGENGAGIGGGKNRGNATITITGGSVNATGMEDGAGIGGGYGGSNGKVNEGSGIVISGGTVNACALPEDGGAGIGGGKTSFSGGGEGGEIRITGGNVHGSGYYAIGMGHQLIPEDYNQTVDLYSEAAVTTVSADSDDYVKADEREYTCIHSKSVWIKPCNHKNAEITANETYHEIKCQCCAIDPARTEHTVEVTEKAVAPTCTEAGMTAGKKCSVCGKILGVPQEVAALGHNWGDWKVTKAATVSTKGEETRECSNCHKKETRSIPELTPEPIPESGTDIDQKDKDGTTVEPELSAASVHKAITSMKSDKDLPGSTFGRIKLRSPKQTTKSIRLNWTKVSKAKTYIIYGNKCGNTNKPKKLYTVTGNAKTLKKVAGARIKKGTYYKFIVVAIDQNNNVVSISKLIHVAAKGGKVGNYKGVRVSSSAVTKAAAMKKGQSLKTGAKAVAQSKKLKVRRHVAMRYESSNKKIATVSSKGAIKARGTGTCYVYAYAQNGVYKRIKVVVK